MIKINFQEVWKPALILAAICLIITSALAGTDALTKGPIAELAEQNEIATRQTVLPLAEKFEALPTSGLENIPYYGTDSSGSIVGYVLITEGKGYGGTITVMTGISTEGVITGVSILNNGETVGLGANCTKDSFTSQYTGTSADQTLTVTKSTPADGEIQALTGATIPSKAVTAAVQQALTDYASIAK